MELRLCGPGLANKLGVRWAAHTATTFPGTPLAGAEVVGMPLRREIRELRPAMLRAEAMTYFGLEPGRPTLVITGGSLGAASLNEAFAAVAMRFMKDMGITHEVTNVNGGAIAMGHPLGATGAMILGTLVDELARRDQKRGLATLCVGGGMGIATIVELC